MELGSLQIRGLCRSRQAESWREHQVRWEVAWEQQRRGRLGHSTFQIKGVCAGCGTKGDVSAAMKHPV